MLQGRRILLGVSGGIAAYKTPELVRLFIKAGAEVQVVMTESAKHFVSDLTLSTVSKRPALSEYFTKGKGGASAWNNHVELGLWPDIMLFAPLTANSLAKMARGESDNLLLATYLSARCPVVVAPAMDLDMYAHPSTQRNLRQLEEDGCQVIPAASGELASGLKGQGRLPEPQELFDYIDSFFFKGPLSNKKLLINAGPTYEAIDPVRFIGNHSSGKMGLALAVEAVKRGAQVHLVVGPVSIEIPDLPDLQVERVTTSAEMNEACIRAFDNVDVAIASAAVSDYRPAKMASSKIKKADQSLDIQLEPTPDILKGMGQAKKDQILVGFALETDNAEANGKGKLERKNLDLIVVNQPTDKTGFGADTNQAILLDSSGNRVVTELVSKTELANQILNKVQELLP